MSQSVASTKRHSPSPKRGTSIVEVMVAIAVVGVVMTAVTAVVSVSLQNTSRSKAKSLGTKYTQEGIEYFRAQKNLMGWESFLTAVQEGGASPTYCLASLPYSQNGGFELVPNRPCVTSEFVDVLNLYKRAAFVTLTPVNGEPTVTVTVTTTWPDGSNTTESTATQQFQQYRN